MRALLFTALLFSALPAAVIEAEYTISYGILPSIGTATLRFESADGRYRIRAEARLHGLAALLARHHVERHTSIGHIGPGGTLVPERYETLRTLDGFKRLRLYLFKHPGRTVYFEETVDRNVTDNRFDPVSMHFRHTTVPEHSVVRFPEPYLADNDLLTLYFNARDMLAHLHADEKRILYAAGAGRGIVRVARTDAPSQFTLMLDQDIFRSKEGRMSIETDSMFYVKKALLKDVFLFGDLKVERVRFTKSP